MRFATIAATALAVAAASPQAIAQDAPQSEVIQASFERAMHDLLAGNPEDAIPLLRGILGRDPALVRVRLELARAYFKAREFEASRRQFQIVLSSPDIPPIVRENVLRFLRRIDEERGLQTNLSFALVAPTGGGIRYDSDTVMLNLFGTPLPFTLNRPNAPQIALQIEGSVRKQWSLESEVLGGNSTVYLRGRALLQEAEGRAFDQQKVDAAAGLQLTWPRQTALMSFFKHFPMRNCPDDVRH